MSDDGKEGVMVAFRGFGELDSGFELSQMLEYEIPDPKMSSCSPCDLLLTW